jgi:spermidine synthase
VLDLSREAWLIEALCLLVGLGLLAARARIRRGKLIASRRGLGRRILVLDRAGYRELTFASEDGAFAGFAGEAMLQARVSLASPLVSGIPYTDGLHLGALAAERKTRALFLGGGAALVPRQYLELYPGIEIHVAEIDPEVACVARDYFFVAPHPRLTLTVEDGREALSAAEPGSLDVIVVDAFGVGVTPRTLASAPFFALCRARLRPGGAVVVNLAGALVGPRSAQNRRIYAGMAEAFGPSGISAFSVPREDDVSPESADNSIVLAQKDALVPPAAALAQRAAALPRSILPHLAGILACGLDIDPMGARPIADPASGHNDALRVW